MPISETRLRVLLDDRASAGLKNLNTSYAKFSSTIQQSGSGFSSFAANANKASESLSNMNKTMERLVYSASRYFVIYKAMGAVGDVWDTLVGGSYDYAKSLETNQIGIAGILKSMITLNGEQVKWNDAMAISGKAMKGLQSEALRTAATSKELIETFRAILGPGLSSGMSIDQIVQLSTVGTNAVRSLGLPTNQYVQELRSMITEGIRPASSTLATSLGITNKDIKAAKASSEGLFKFLMDRMTGFADAVKYTSGTVEGRIARIQEGLQVAGAKGAKALYESWSSVLERIANYLIPIPEKLGDKWEINPAFVKSIENISNTVGKIADSLADFGGAISPLLGALGGTGLTAIGQVADKLKYILGFLTAKTLAPFVADIAKIAVNSREAYEAETGLGRAIQGVSDKLRGRTAELQRLASAQAEYNAFTHSFFDNLNFLNSMQGMVNSNANSLTNLSKKWVKMGVDAKMAGEMQKEVLNLLASGNSKALHQELQMYDFFAKQTQDAKAYEDAVLKAYNTEVQAIRKVIQEQNSKKLSDKEQVTKFLGASGDKKPYKWQIESTNELIAKLQQLGLEEEKVYNLAVMYTNALKKGGQDAAAAISAQIVASGQRFADTQKNLVLEEKEVALSSEMILKESALANARRQGGEAAVQMLQQIIAKNKELVAALKQKGIDTSQMEREYIRLLNELTSATDKNTFALLENYDAKMKAANGGKTWAESAKSATEKASMWISAIGGLTMGFGMLCDFLGQADEENKEWYESAGNAAMQAGMFAMAVGSITSAVGQMIPIVLQGAAALRAFAQAKGMAALGLAGGVVAGIGATVYNAYKNYQETGIASQLDEYGNEISHNFNGMRDIDDADSYAILNNSSYNYGTNAVASAIGLAYDKSGGGGGGGKGGGSSKANKAAEYLERMNKIVADLNKEMTNMRGNATAYEKAMAAAEDKIAGYQKDIVKAEQLGVDTAKVRKAIDDYMLASRKKALELQEDENLKFMKLNEESAQRINVLGLGSMDQQREIYGQRLEEHKAYLEELLSADIENVERRMQLEQELANVQKQINDNSVYEFKSGWTQALDELANRQINFKDAFVSAFDSIEGSLVNLVSGTESAKDKFKKFCEEVTSTILKSMTQIIIRGLITKAIMSAIGLGGSIGAGNLSNMSDLAKNFTGGSLVGSGGISVGLAGGGIAQAGGTYVVGENGPELLQMGSQRGRVYNNRESKNMSGIENVKVEVVNKSGQEVKADNASVRFDGRTMIISTVIEAVNTNYMGMRSMLKGVATT